MTIPLALVGIGTAAYLLMAWRLRRTTRRVDGWRITSLLCGSSLLILGLLPQYLPFPEGDFRKHMLEHLLIGMIAPIGLVMAAPLTLLLRMMPPHGGRWLSRLLRTPLPRFIAHPFTALTLDMGGMAALYFTPLYMAMMMHPALHYLVHLHFVLAGCLYSWVIAGPDPAPHRPSVLTRIVVLGVAIVIHSVLAQMLYAGIFVSIPVPPEQLRHGAELMYYGGDISEMLLAVALVSTWRPSLAHAPPKSAERAPSATATAIKA